MLRQARGGLAVWLHFRHNALVAVCRDAVNQLHVGLGNRNLQHGFSLAGMACSLGGYGAFVGTHRHNPLRYINVNTKKLRLFT
jgi:hypothetical protein